jgi:hypothetical protein
MLIEAARKHQINLGLIVAETALWANPEVHRRLLKDNRSGAFYPNVRRAAKSKGEKKGGRTGGIRLDDNTYANYAIKKAIGLHRSKNLIGFATCHIWPRTCYDEKYHTAMPNLVLLPAALASLTDHNSEIQALLQYRSFELYKWVPEGELRPPKPKSYPTCWRPPQEFTAKIDKAIRNRRL